MHIGLYVDFAKYVNFDPWAWNSIFGVFEVSGTHFWMKIRLDAVWHRDDFLDINLDFSSIVHNTEMKCLVSSYEELVTMSMQ